MKVPTAHQALVVTSLLLLGTSAFAQEKRETPLDLPLETDASAIPRSSTARAVRNLAELVRLIKNNSFVAGNNLNLCGGAAQKRMRRQRIAYTPRDNAICCVVVYFDHKKPLESLRSTRPF